MSLRSRLRFATGGWGSLPRFPSGSRAPNGRTSCTFSGSETSSPPPSRRGADSGRSPTYSSLFGMFEPRVRKVRLKKVFDATVAATVASSASAIVVTLRARTAHGHRRRRDFESHPRPRNGFPAIPASRERPGTLRRSLGLLDEPIVLPLDGSPRGRGSNCCSRSWPTSQPPISSSPVRRWPRRR